MTRSGRSAAGIAAIGLLIVIWAALVASLSPIVGKWPVLVQGAFYLVVGVAWILPVKPLIRWVVTGSRRAPGPAPGPDR